MQVFHVRPNCSPKVEEQIGFKDFSWETGPTFTLHTYSFILYWISNMGTEKFFYYL